MLLLSRVSFFVLLDFYLSFFLSLLLGSLVELADEGRACRRGMCHCCCICQLLPVEEEAARKEGSNSSSIIDCSFNRSSQFSAVADAQMHWYTEAVGTCPAHLLLRTLAYHGTGSSRASIICLMSSLNEVNLCKRTGLQRRDHREVDAYVSC